MTKGVNLLVVAIPFSFLVRVFSQRRIEPSEAARGHPTTVDGKM